MASNSWKSPQRRAKRGTIKVGKGEVLLLIGG
jgi:hypothetical protein